MTDTTASPAPEAGAAKDAGGATSPEEQAKVAELVETLAREAADYKDKLLRTLADMENLRRRTDREVADAKTYSVAAFARDILGVADNMDRALTAIEGETRGQAEAGVKALLDGVDLTAAELLRVLEKHGVKKFEPKGEKFDPHLHQAMYEVPDPSVPNGTVAQVIQAGYRIGERILRPALVGVAKGGPKPPRTDAPAEDSPAGNAGGPTDPQDSA
jgi:molecular chaperone GrpE